MANDITVHSVNDDPQWAPSDVDDFQLQYSLSGDFSDLQVLDGATIDGDLVRVKLVDVSGEHIVGTGVQDAIIRVDWFVDDTALRNAETDPDTTAPYTILPGSTALDRINHLGGTGTRTITARVYWSAGGSQDVTAEVTVTADAAAPTITNIATSPTTGTVTITFDTDVAADTVVEYGVDTGYGFSKSNASLVTSHEILITGLNPETTYHFRVSVTDAWSQTTTSDDQTFTTTAVANDTTAPVMSSIAGSAAVTSATVTLDTDELATVEVDYGTTTGYGTTVETTTLALEHSLPLSGLTASTTYYFRVRATDEVGNVSSWDDNSGAGHQFTTSADSGLSIPSDPDDVGLVAVGRRDASTYELTGLTLVDGSVNIGLGRYTDILPEPLSGDGSQANPYVWEDLNITGGVTTFDPETYFTLRRCRIRGLGDVVVKNNHGNSQFTLEDCELGYEGGKYETESDTVPQQAAVGTQGPYIIRRCYIHNVPDGAKLNYPATIEQCYIRAYKISGSSVHTDGSQSTGPEAGTYVFRYNNVRPNQHDGDQSPTGVTGNACLYIQNNPQSSDDRAEGTFIVENNLFQGGGFNMRLYGADTALYTITVRDNQFHGPYYTSDTAGQNGGPLHATIPLDKITWSGNVDECGNPLTLAGLISWEDTCWTAP